MENITGTEAKILAAAVEVFCRRGFDGARMQEIADQAGISKASLHYYFRSKEGLFKRAVQVLFSQLINNVISHLSPESSIEEMIRQLVNSYYEVFIQYRRQALFFFSEMIKYEELLDEIVSALPRHEILLNVVGRFEQERRKGTIMDITPQNLLVNIIAMCMYPIIAAPLIRRMFNMSEAEMTAYIEQRKVHVADFVLASILKEQP